MPGAGPVLRRNGSFFLAGFLFLPNPGVQARDSDTDRLVALVAVMKQRHEQYNPVFVKYRVQYHFTIYNFVISSQIDLADKKRMGRLRDAKVESTCEFAAKGAKRLDRQIRPLVSADGIIHKPRQTGVTVYDGKLLTEGTLEENQYAISRNPDSRPPPDPFSDFTGDTVLLGLPEKIKAGKLPNMRITVAIDTKTIPGSQYCITLRNEGDSDVWNAWLTSEETGCCILRFERKDLEGRLLDQNTDAEYGVVDGVSYPKTAVWKNYYFKEGVHELAFTQKLIVDSITLRDKDIPDTLFTLAVPKGARLIDRDLNNQVLTDPDEIQKHIDEAVKSVGPRGRIWPWIFLGIAMAVLIASVVVFRKARFGLRQIR